MENYPSSSSNNNNHQQFLVPMPLRACPPNSDQSSSTSVQQNVESTYSSVTPLRNNRMYDPKMKRLTEVKRVARNRRKFYPKYGPYPCQWCPRVLRTSQSFAGHMRAHYRRLEFADKMAAKQEQRRLQKQQKQLQQQQSIQQHQQRQTHAEAQLEKERAKAVKLARFLAKINAKVRAHDTTPAPAPAPAPEPEPVPVPVPVPAPAPAPVPVPVPVPLPAEAPAPVPAPVASGSGKQPLRMNDIHLRLSNSQFGQIITAGNKNNLVSTESASNATDFCLYTRRRSITSPNSSSADVLHHHHFLQVPPGLVSMYKSCIDFNKKPVVKQEAFPDHEDVKPPPGFHNQLLSSEGPHDRRFLTKKEIIEIDDDDDDDDDVVAYGSWDDLALRL